MIDNVTVEQAWEPFGSLNRRMGSRRAQDAARALALAVLEEVMDGVMKSQQFLDYYELRKRLEELGR